MEPPKGLDTRGRAYWASVVGAYELTDTELELLAEACHTLDDLDLLEAAIAQNGAMVEGAAGQPVVNPALTEARGQRLALHRLVSALDLPDEDGASIPTAVTIRNRSAARARWRKGA
jgi:hypothetical protein